MSDVSKGEEKADEPKLFESVAMAVMYRAGNLEKLPIAFVRSGVMVN